MKAYKLTDQNSKTKNNTQWGEGVEYTVSGNGLLCSSAWIHFYTDPLIAVLMNPAHADFQHPILWECETSGEHLHESLKSGCKTLKTIKQIPLPEITLIQKIAFGILCSLELKQSLEYIQWANNWLNGVDRSRESAYAADAATDAATDAAYYAADAATTTAVYYATYAADADAAAAYAADAATATAAYAADISNKQIDFIALANKALTYK